MHKTHKLCEKRLKLWDYPAYKVARTSLTAARYFSRSPKIASRTWPKVKSLSFYFSISASLSPHQNFWCEGSRFTLLDCSLYLMGSISFHRLVVSLSNHRRAGQFLPRSSAEGGWYQSRFFSSSMELFYHLRPHPWIRQTGGVFITSLQTYLARPKLSLAFRSLVRLRAAIAGSSGGARR